MNVRALLLAIASLTCVAASALGQARPVTLEWDPSPERSVVGYIVYVGSASGAYDEQHDVGSQTSFVYASVVPGRPYYFAVAAYSSGPTVGPRSEEVFFLAGGATASSLRPREPRSDDDTARAPVVGPASSDGPTDTDDSGVLCVGGAGCYQVEALAHVDGRASALTRAPDGRVLLIEDGKHVRVIDDDVLVLEPALTAAASEALVGLVLDPRFADTRFVYVGVVEATADGRRELNVVRYREVANVLGERAVIVAGLPLPMVGDAALAIDAAGRIYVAMPAAPSSDPRAARYAGMVLRFESDGSTVGDDGADAPVLSRGYAQPTALAWSGAGDDLWLAGTDAEWTGTLARLPLNRASAGPAAVPESVSLPAGSTAVSLSVPEPIAGPTPDTAAEAAVFVVDEAGGVSQVTVTPDGMTTTPWIDADELGGRVVAVGGGAVDGGLLLAVTAREPASASSQIIRLRRQ
jgi:hypothetical protein